MEPERRPQYGARTYTITQAGIKRIDEYHRYRPTGPAETEEEMICRIVRIMGQPLAVEFVYHNGAIQHADARTIEIQSRRP